MKILFLSTILAVGLLSAPAYAESPRGAAAATISTAGLDLATEAGARALDLRILHAASQLCGTPSPADARGRIKQSQCRDAVLASAAPARRQAVELARTRQATIVAAAR